MQTLDINLLLISYISMAELRFLQKKHDAARDYWTQAQEAFYGLYRDSEDWILLRRMDRHSRLEIHGIFKRILRLLLCFHPRIISEYAHVLDSYNTLETFMYAHNDFPVSSLSMAASDIAEALGDLPHAHTTIHRVGTHHGHHHTRSLSGNQPMPRGNPTMTFRSTSELIGNDTAGMFVCLVGCLFFYFFKNMLQVRKRKKRNEYVLFVVCGVL